MKFKEDEWLTDYINAVHFTVRLIEKKGRNAEATRLLEAETAALIQDAILGHIPLEVFSIQRIARRVKAARTTALTNGPVRLKTYRGDAGRLATDYGFVRDGFSEITLEEMIAECAGYFAKVYPDLPDLRATITELFQRDIEQGVIEPLSGGDTYRVVAVE